MNDIPIRGELVSSLPGVRREGDATKEAGESFKDIIKHKIREINELQIDADTAIERVELSDSGSIHEAMMALEKANISFRAMMQVRNKILEAYQEVMRMQT